MVLCAHGKEGGERLQAGLDEEEGRSEESAEDAGGSAGEDVDAERLDGRVVVDDVGEVGADRFIEAQTAAIEGHLVDVLCRVLEQGRCQDGIVAYGAGETA